MDESTRSKYDSEVLTPDVQALLTSATAESSANRTKRRAAAGARAEKIWLERKRRHTIYNRRSDRSLVALLATCWIGAGLTYFFF